MRHTHFWKHHQAAELWKEEPSAVRETSSHLCKLHSIILQRNTCFKDTCMDKDSKHTYRHKNNNFKKFDFAQVISLVITYRCKRWNFTLTSPSNKILLWLQVDHVGQAIMYYDILVTHHSTKSWDCFINKYSIFNCQGNHITSVHREENRKDKKTSALNTERLLLATA